MEFEIFGKSIAFGKPRRLEMIFLFFYAVFFLWWDVLQNKVLDNGLNYSVSWIAGTTTSALDLGIIILVLFHICLMALFVMSLQSKDTHKLFDILIGALAFFGVAIVLSGFINSLYSDTIRFLFIDMPSVNFYHIGVLIEMIAGTYWAITQ